MPEMLSVSPAHEVGMWTDEMVAQAELIWADYQTQHDLTSLRGQAAGIDPIGRAVFFGRTATEIVTRLRTEGAFRELYFVRVGQNYYAKKGGQR